MNLEDCLLGEDIKKDDLDCVISNLKDYFHTRNV